MKQILNWEKFNENNNNISFSERVIENSFQKGKEFYKKGDTLLFLSEGEYTTVLSHYRFENNAMNLIKMEVQSAYTNQGYENIMLNRLKDICEENNLKNIDTKVVTLDRDFILFYINLGFEKIVEDGMTTLLRLKL